VSGHGFLRQFHRALHDWWRDQSRQRGIAGATTLLAHELWEFLRDSTPERRRRRFGDMEYDWEHHVNTTSGTVAWRERLLGVFLSAYQPTEPAAFQEMMRALKINFSDYTFVDLGSGKGRTLLMASEYPFRRVIGVELLPELHQAAVHNISDYKSPTQLCSQVESVCSDASRFPLPDDPLLLYLFNPLPESSLQQVMLNLEDSLRRKPRDVGIVYHNPILEGQLNQLPWLKMARHGDHYAIFVHESSWGLLGGRSPAASKIVSAW